MMKLLSIALATAAAAAFTVDADTNKTLASTPANVIDSVLLPPLSSTTTMEADQPDLNSDEAYDPFLGLQQRNLEDVEPSEPSVPTYAPTDGSRYVTYAPTDDPAVRL